MLHFFFVILVRFLFAFNSLSAFYGLSCTMLHNVYVSILSSLSALSITLLFKNFSSCPRVRRIYLQLICTHLYDWRPQGPLPLADFNLFSVRRCYGLNRVLPEFKSWSLNTPVTSACDLPYRGHLVNMRSSGWTLIQCDWWPYHRGRRSGRRHM